MKSSRRGLKSKLLRVIDANYNRAKEAMRVVEDIFRFIVEDARLTARWKRARHDLSQILMSFPVGYRVLLLSRDSADDVGRRSMICDCNRAVSWQDLLAANLKRMQEALRVLEEFSKIVAPRESPKFQALRFRLYELEKISLSEL